MTQAWLDRDGAVTENPDDTVAWHYGDPLREQRRLGEGAVVDRSDRRIITVSGDERLTWLHSLTTQHLADLSPGQGTELMVLSPNGHIEHHAGVYDDGSTTWLDTEPESGKALLDYLLKMRFFTPVEVEDVSDRWALASHTGSTDLAAPDLLTVPDAKFATGTLTMRATAIYAGEALPDGGFVRRTDELGMPMVDLLVPRDSFNDLPERLDLPVAGRWAFDMLRIGAERPVVGVDTDHRTIPHEVLGLLARAVHLDKGCYRGQETVARVHHLGKPPRRLVPLHLDGSDEHPPEVGTDVVAGSRTVGRIGTAGRHYEDGMIALALLRRNVADKPETTFDVAGSAASL
ncbi:MAG TPA: folate-binding protein [Candidatus Stackebrandtia excrementipullorum]|nr:folate-binding protein [Candidatus Stackebrandtia excrementipullorum]